jgi:hypothetical protein
MVLQLLASLSWSNGLIRYLELYCFIKIDFLKKIIIIFYTFKSISNVKNNFFKIKIFIFYFNIKKYFKK